MKRILILSILGLLAASHSQACSMAVNDLYQRNLLVGIAASQLKIDLTSVTATQVENYSKSFSGSVGSSQCPSHLNTSERVTFNFKNRMLKCQASIVVNRAVQVGDELVDGSYESISSTGNTSQCAL